MSFTLCALCHATFWGTCSFSSTLQIQSLFTATQSKTPFRASPLLFFYACLSFLRFWITKFQFPHRPLVWKEDAVPGFCRFTAESHESRAPTRPGQANRGGRHTSTHSSGDTTRQDRIEQISVTLQFDGQRNKLVACDGNEIDTMFVDRRRDGGLNGQTLVRKNKNEKKKLSTESFKLFFFPSDTICKVS